MAFPVILLIGHIGTCAARVTSFGVSDWLARPGMQSPSVTASEALLMTSVRRSIFDAPFGDTMSHSGTDAIVTLASCRRRTRLLNAPSYRVQVSETTHREKVERIEAGLSMHDNAPSVRI